MNSVGEDCSELKRTYDSCFNRWFAEKFLKGKIEEDSDCKEIFTSYQSCVKKALKSQNISLDEVEKDVLGTPEENQPPPKD
ncbi:TP53-regulated inhibitor of apoptosis 1-like isoform X2 [Penaeus vannamei]